MPATSDHAFVKVVATIVMVLGVIASLVGLLAFVIAIMGGGARHQAYKKERALGIQGRVELW